MMAKEQYILELGMLEQEAGKLQQQMYMIDQQVLELQNLQMGLQELEKSEEKEMLANLGKSIFIKTEILSKNLLVDVGNRTFVKKSIPGTLKIVDEQLGKLIDVKNKILQAMQELQEEMERLIAEAEKEK